MSDKQGQVGTDRLAFYREGLKTSTSKVHWADIGILLRELDAAKADVLRLEAMCDNLESQLSNSVTEAERLRVELQRHYADGPFHSKYKCLSCTAETDKHGQGDHLPTCVTMTGAE